MKKADLSEIEKQPFGKPDFADPIFVERIRKYFLEQVMVSDNITQATKPQLLKLVSNLTELLNKEIWEKILLTVEGTEERKRKFQESLSANAKKAANALHDQPGGSREKQRKIQEAWATGKYTSRTACALKECEIIGMSYDAARRALRKTPNPKS